MKSGHAAVIDIGKTNAKLALVDLSDLSEIEVVTRPNTVRDGPPWPHFDTEGHWRFILDGLRTFNARHGVDAITITTHGASAALLDARGALAAPILDYEHAGPDTLAEAYDVIRPDFSETGSPRLGMGLNIGAQLFWQFERDPGLKARVRTIVTYPQFWGHRLTGVAATDMTSLGCHTDLWNPRAGRLSSLCETLGIVDSIAPARRPDEVLGSILPDIAKQTGLNRDVPVFVGIHDSNASLLPHLLSHVSPFSVVSTGTWVIAMAIGGRTGGLDPDKDVVVNVSAHGSPVPSARFMGGREHDLAAGQFYTQPSDDDLTDILTRGIMLLPAVEPTSGPFKGQSARWQGAEPPPGSAARGTTVALYLALVTQACLANIGHAGPIVVEGPFARNRLFLRMLAVATGCPVIASKGATGTSQGAALLVRQKPVPIAAPVTLHAEDDPAREALQSYAGKWRELAGSG